MKVILDQIQAACALCQTHDGRTLLIDSLILDKSAKEGDVVKYKSCAWTIDEESNTVRKSYIKKLISNVFED